MADVVGIRLYAERDRPAIRRICCDTAVRGEPVERLFPDREAVADFVTRYYTDYEPRSLWVAEFDGRVIGYLTGCLDSRRYLRVMSWQVVPPAVCRAIGRGVLWHRATWQLLRAAVTTWRLGGFRRRFSLDAYPAHLHLNVQQGFRGQQVGRRLLERFAREVAAAGLRGIHASVRDDNPSACRFFEQLGFAPLSRYPIAAPVGETVQLHQTIIYGKQV